MPNEFIPKVTEITEGLLNTVLDALDDTPDEIGTAAIAFLKSKKDVLIGLAAEPLVNLLRSLGQGSKTDVLAAKLAFVATLPTAALVNEFYAASVEALEKSTEAPLRLGSILRSIADVGAKIAPRLAGIVASLIGL